MLDAWPNLQWHQWKGYLQSMSWKLFSCIAMFAHLLFHVHQLPIHSLTKWKHKWHHVKEILIKIKKDKSKKKSKDDKKKKRNRNTYFCIGVCDTWNLRNSFNGTVPIHTILKWLRDKYDLKWLRISMSYHKFSNLGEIFQGDLNNKLMKNITSKDFMDLMCNCTNSTTINGNCIYNGNCRKSIVIYKATCKECGCYYIGNTQQKLKLRMNQHFADTKDL